MGIVPVPQDRRGPNVLLIVCDDLGWGDLSCHGNPHLATPHLDRLHEEGVRFTRYLSGPVSSPARASLMTGRYHFRTGVLDTYCGRSMLNPSEVTLATYLRGAGYRTGAFGKWHLGDCHPARPIDVGFDTALTHRAGGIGQPGDHPDNHFREAEAYHDPVLYRDGVPEKSSGFCTDVFTDAAMAFIERRRDETWFAYLATNAPHTPLIIDEAAVKPFRERGINDTHARLYATVKNIDDNVGRLLRHVTELGLEQETIVVFTSDHGPCGSARDPGAAGAGGHRFNAGLKGIKGSVYEGGVRVPNFWRWRGSFPGGRDIDSPAHPIDVLPTLGEACDARISEGPTVDGMSWLDVLRGERVPDAAKERTIFMQWHRGDRPVRYRNFAAVGRRYKLVRTREEAEDELYDLAEDPREERNLASEKPEIVTTLRKAYDSWLDDVAQTRGPGTFDPPAISVGSKRENPVLLTQNDMRVLGDEGWRRWNLRGYWEVNVRDAGPYRISLTFPPGTPPGSAHVRLEDFELARPLGKGDPPNAAFEGITLRQGRGRLEAWCRTAVACDDALYGRFVPALYVEMLRVAG